MSARPAVTVIGLGIMGGAMVRHLVAAGFAVTGCDPDAAARERAAAAGAEVRETLDPATIDGVVLLSLPSGDTVRAVLAALAAAGKPLVIADTSTLALDDKLALAALLDGTPHRLLDCPVSGTGAQMAARDAVIYAGGDPAAIDFALPALSAVARRVIRLGAYGAGTRAKLVANNLVAVHNVATAEAMRLGSAAGIAPEALIEAIRDGAGTSRIFELRAPMIAADQYQPATMKLSVWAKDMSAIAQFARAAGVPLALLDAVAPLYERAMGQGAGELDTAAVARALPGLDEEDHR